MLNSMKIKIQEEIPEIEEYCQLHQAVGWSLPPRDIVKRGLAGSLYCLCGRKNKQLAGMCRIVGDGGFIFFVVDMMVFPPFQRQGLGTSLMQKICDYLKATVPDNAYITLMAAKGKEAFYEKFGFFRRPTEEFGHGMMMPIGGHFNYENKI